MSREQTILRQFTEQIELLKVGDPIAVNNSVSVVPLLWPSTEPSPVELYEESLERGDVELTEKGEGTVPEIRVHNRGERPILIPEGTILVGARQNRVANVTIIVCAKTSFDLPVSCVEAGRWGWRSRRFRLGWFAPPSLRREKTKHVYWSSSRGERGHADQLQVWAYVRNFLDEREVDSFTEDLAEAYAKYEQQKPIDPDELLRKLPEQTAGLAVAVGDHIVGLDLFDEAKKLRQTFRRLIAGYLAELLWYSPLQSAKLPPVTTEVARQFLNRVTKAARVREKPIGMSEELDIASDELVGMAVMYEGRICHMAVFSDKEIPGLSG